MIEKFDLRVRLDSLEVGDDDQSNEHMAYRIVLSTDLGQIVIRGNHDDGPTVEMPEGVEGRARG